MHVARNLPSHVSAIAILYKYIASISYLIGQRLFVGHPQLASLQARGHVGSSPRVRDLNQHSRNTPTPPIFLSKHLSWKAGDYFYKDVFPISVLSSSSVPPPTTAMMPRNKPRLNIALYARPNLPDDYHYALIVSPKDGSSGITMYHATNARRSAQGIPSQRWRHEKFTLNSLSREPRLLVLVTVAKLLVPLEGITEILQDVPIYQPGDGDEYKAFNCAAWVRSAIQRLYDAKAIAGDAGRKDWSWINDRVLKFVAEEKQEGQWDDHGWTGGTEIPILDLLHEK